MQMEARLPPSQLLSQGLSGMIQQARCNHRPLHLSEMQLRKYSICAAGFERMLGMQARKVGGPTAARNWPRQPAHEEMGSVLRATSSQGLAHGIMLDKASPC